MSEQPNPEANNDRLIVLLAYVFSPLVPIIILLLEDKKNRPFIKAHNAQALALGVVVMVLGIVLSWTICVPFLLWIVEIYYGFQAYNGKEVTIPVITDFVKNQGWA